MTKQSDTATHTLCSALALGIGRESFFVPFARKPGTLKFCTSKSATFQPQLVTPSRKVAVLPRRSTTGLQPGARDLQGFIKQEYLGRRWGDDELLGGLYSRVHCG